MTSLPPPRGPGRYSVTLVCLGNICRSPMAHVVLEAKLEEAGLADRVEVTSSGTGGWHVGDPMDDEPPRRSTRPATTRPGTAPASTTRPAGRRTTWCWRWTAATSRTWVARDDRVRLFRDFDPADPGADVPDPYYGGPAGFEEVLRMVERTTESIVDALQREHALR